MESGYGRPRPSHTAALTEVGPGAPAGEPLRRYRQPVGLSSELGDLPAPVGVHASEHLATPDRGVIMTRKMVKKAIDAVTRGDDPAGVIRDPKLHVVRTTAGDAVVAAAAERS